jgi:hypothetical protein
MYCNQVYTLVPDDWYLSGIVRYRIEMSGSGQLRPHRLRLETSGRSATNANVESGRRRTRGCPLVGHNNRAVLATSHSVVPAQCHVEAPDSEQTCFTAA